MSDPERQRVFTLKALLGFITSFAVVLGFSQSLGLPTLAIALFFLGLSLWVVAYRLDLPLLYLPGALIYASSFVYLAIGK